MGSLFVFRSGVREEASEAGGVPVSLESRGVGVLFEEKLGGRDSEGGLLEERRLEDSGSFERGRCRWGRSEVPHIQPMKLHLFVLVLGQQREKQRKIKAKKNKKREGEEQQKIGFVAKNNKNWAYLFVVFQKDLSLLLPLLCQDCRGFAWGETSLLFWHFSLFGRKMKEKKDRAQ